MKKKKIISECKKCLQEPDYFENVYNNSNKEDKNWILGYLSIEKVVIPYGKIKSYDNPNVKRKIFF